MAIYLEDIPTGTYGNTIVYERNGIKFTRKKGNTGRQAPVAKKQASVLGKASAISARLRTAFKPLLPDPGNRRLMYRLNNALQQWLRKEPHLQTEQVNEIADLKGFSFSEDNMGNMFHAVMPVSRTSNESLVLHIPAFDSPNPISPLPFNGKIDIQIIAACCDINNAADIRSYITELNIDYSGTPIPAQDVILPLQTAAGSLTVVAVSINKTAAGIVGAFWN